MPNLRLLAGIVIAAWSYAAPPRPVILTTDCGADMDDQWALAHLVLSPEFDVRAVVTTHTGKYPILKPPAAESSARNAREVVDHMPLGKRPVIMPGSSVPLTSRKPLGNSGVERIIAESRSFSRGHRLTVLVIGAATDAASALLTDPRLADRIEIVAMGFTSWPDGGDEFNIHNDPIAWQVILDSRVPVTVGDSAVCKRDLALTSERAHGVLDGAGAPGRYLAALLDDWFAKHSDVVVSVMGNGSRWPVWDEVTVAYLLGMAKVESRPRPRLQPDLRFDLGKPRGTINWVTAVDGARLWSDLARRLQRAKGAHAAAGGWTILPGREHSQLAVGQ